MTESALKNKIGFLLIIANFAVIILTFVFYLIGGFLFDEMTTVVALIVPMFSVYTTAIIKNFIDNKNVTRDSSKSVNKQYIFISWLFPSAFSIYLISVIVLKAYNVGFSSFEQFKTMLVASETIFGAYAGLVLASMFEIEKKNGE